MTTATAGERTIIKMRTGIAIHMTTVSACCLHKSFGTISPKIKTITVIITVARVEAIASPPLTPDSSAMAIEVAAVDAAIFARLLPISIAERAMVKCSLILFASLAVLEPASPALRRRILLAALKDISLPEKKADSTSIRSIINPYVIYFAADIRRSPPFFRNRCDSRLHRLYGRQDRSHGCRLPRLPRPQRYRT